MLGYRQQLLFIILCWLLVIGNSTNQYLIIVYRLYLFIIFVLVFTTIFVVKISIYLAKWKKPLIVIIRTLLGIDRYSPKSRYPWKNNVVWHELFNTHNHYPATLHHERYTVCRFSLIAQLLTSPWYCEITTRSLSNPSTNEMRQTSFSKNKLSKKT